MNRQRPRAILMRRTRIITGLGLGGLLLIGVTAGAWGQAPAQHAGTSPSDFNLVGTVEGKHNRAAVFEDPHTKKQASYRVGDVVNGATILSITHQQVVLKRGTETLVLHITGGTGVVHSASPERAPSDAIPVPTDSKNPRQDVISKVIPPYDPRVQKIRVEISRSDVMHFVADFEAQVNDGKPVLVTTSVGSAVDLAQADPDVIRALGLEMTDQIVEINGMGIDSLDRFRQVLEIMGGKRGGNRVGTFNISVLRDGSFKPFYYAVKQ